jgi:hypothetical protein
VRRSSAPENGSRAYPTVTSCPKPPLRLTRSGQPADRRKKEILAGLLAELGIPTTELPEGVRVARRGGITIWMNFNLEPVTLADGSALGPVSFHLQQRTESPQ